MGALLRGCAVLLALVICGVVALGVYQMLGRGLAIGHLLPAGGLEGAVSDVPRSATFTIRQGESAAEVGDELQRQGLIRSALAFRWEIESKRLGSRLEAGDYELGPSMTTGEIVAVLARGSVSSGSRITVLEGWRAEQVAQRVEELGLAKADDFLRIVRSPREAGVTPPDSTTGTLEGYLFPDTYEIDRKATPQQIVETMLRGFDQRFAEPRRRQSPTQDLDLVRIVTLASIVEREAAQPAERPLVASVYTNRLAAGMRLEADPTVQYALVSLDSGSVGSYGYWKRELSAQDLKADSPYNTYRVAGLPPGPICSPGLEALRSAAAPAQTGYYFFMARGDGSHAFAETPDEHFANVRRYR